MTTTLIRRSRTWASLGLIATALVLGACAHRPTNSQIGTGVGAVAGGVVGDALFGTTLGTVGGAAAGALIGQEVGRNTGRGDRGYHRHRR